MNCSITDERTMTTTSLAQEDFDKVIFITQGITALRSLWNIFSPSSH